MADKIPGFADIVAAAGGAEAYNQQSLQSSSVTPQQIIQNIGTGSLSVTQDDRTQIAGMSSVSEDLLKQWDSYHTIDIGIDNTGNIKVDAPEYFINSPEYKTQLEPMFNSLRGRSLDDPTVSVVLSQQTRDELNKINAEAIRPREEAYNLYISQNSGSTRDDAELYYTNAMADKGENTEIAVGLRSDGTLITMKTKDLYDQWANDKVTDGYKIDVIKKYDQIISDPNISSKEKAIFMGARDFITRKDNDKMLSADLTTKLNVLTNSILNATNNGLLGSLWNRLMIGSNEVENREKFLYDANRLKGTGTFSTVGGLLGFGGSLAADLVLGSKGLSFAGTLASNAASTSKAIESGFQTLNTVSKAFNQSKTTKVISDIVSQIPLNITYGLQQELGDAIRGADEYNFSKDFIYNTLADAAVLGTIRGGSTILKSLDTANNSTIRKYSDALSDQLISGATKIEDALSSFKYVDNIFPAIRKVLGSDPIEVAAKRAQASGNISKQDFFTVGSKLRQARTGFAGEANALKLKLANDNKIFESIDNVVANSSLKADEAKKVVNEYLNTAQELARIDAGKKTIYTIDEISAKRDFINKIESSSDFKYIREVKDNIVKSYQEINDMAIRLGVADDDLVKFLRGQNKDYIRLQYAIDPEVKVRFGEKVTPRRNKDVIQKIKSVGGKSANPVDVMFEQIDAIYRVHAQNQGKLLIKQGIDDGWLQGKVILDADDIAKRDSLIASVGAKNTVAQSSIDVSSRNMANDIKAIAGDSGKLTSKKITKEMLSDISSVADNYIDDTIKQIASDGKFSDEATKFIADNPLSSVDELAGELLIKKKDDFIRSISNNLNEYGKEQKEKILSAVIDRFDTRQSSGVFSKFNADYEELSKLKKELSGKTGYTNDNNVFEYLHNGKVGKVRVDDPELVDSMSYYLDKDPGFLRRLSNNISRTFREGTTGLNPVFAVVNPIRDIGTVATTANLGVLNPLKTSRTILESVGMPAKEVDEILGIVDNYLTRGTYVDVSRFAGKATQETAHIERLVKYGKKKTIVKELFGSGVGKGESRIYRSIEDITGSTENMVRKRVAVSTYANAISQGFTHDAAMAKALYYAGQASADFTNVSKALRRVNKDIPYLNAAIQGSASFGRMLQLDPIGVTYRLMTGFATPIAYLTAYTLADEDRAASYYSIPEWQRESNFVVVLPDGSNLLIPMPQEIAKIVNPIRTVVEGTFGYNKESFFRTFGKSLLNLGPVNLSGVLDKNIDGSSNFSSGLLKAGSSLIPQILKPVVSIGTGKDLFTGRALAPTDQELADAGIQMTDGEYKASDYTYTGSDSTLFGGIADILGVKQSSIQNIFKTYTGGVGQNVLWAADSILSSAGVKNQGIGGKSLAESFSDRFFNKSYDQMVVDYYSGVDKLESDKQVTVEQLKNIDEKYRVASEEDKASLAEDWRSISNAYGQKVADFANKYAKFYKLDNGLDRSKTSTMINLLSLGDYAGTSEPGTYQSQIKTDAFFADRNDAIQRLEGMGIKVDKSMDIYGKRTPGGIDFSGTSLIPGIVTNRGYGAPKQVAYEVTRLFSGNKSTGERSLSSIKSDMMDERSRLYNSITNAKTKQEKDNIYSQIDAIERQYLSVVDERLAPIFSKYGYAAIKNKAVLDELEKVVVVPRNDWATSKVLSRRGKIYEKYLSSKSFPLAKADAAEYMLERYGLGGREIGNLPTSDRAIDLINKINSSINNGNISSARDQFKTLVQEINNANVYINGNDSDTIDSVINLTERFK